MGTVEKHPQESTSLTVSNIIFYVFVTTLVAYAVNFKRKRQRLEYLASKIPGPPALPIVGNGLAFIGNPEGE